MHIPVWINCPIMWIVADVNLIVQFTGPSPKKLQVTAPASLPYIMSKPRTYNFLSQTSFVNPVSSCTFTAG